MRFSGFVKIAGLSGVAAALTLSLIGCGAAASSNLAVTQGNWAFTATSSAKIVNKQVASFVLGGNLSQSGDKLSGTLTVDQSGCIAPQTIAFTGTVKGSDITLTSAAFDGNVISVTGTANKDSLTGSYTVTGGCADDGTISANVVPSISGTWTGTVFVSDSPATISVALTQSSSASENGSFVLSGTATYTGSVCEASATITEGSSISGSQLTLNLNTGVTYVATLNSTTAPASAQGDYDSTSSECASSDGIQSVTLAKQ